MKRTIAAFALTAASFAFSMPMPVESVKTICLGIHEDSEGAKWASACDSSENNKILKTPLLKNGCAEKQIALSSRKSKGAKEFDINIYPCMPPNMVQL